MKKFIYILILLVCVCLTGCGETVFYDVTLDAQGGNLNVTSYTVPKGTNFNLPVITKDESETETYTFEGWVIDGTTDIVTSVVVNDNMHLTAQFKTTQKTVVSEKHYAYFIVDGEVVTSLSFEFYESKNNVLPVFETEENKTFEGWYLEPTYENKVDSIDLTLNEDQYFFGYTYTNEVEKYYAYFTIDGTFDSELSFEFYNSGNSTLPTPVKDGYTFSGWYKEETYNTKVETLDVKIKADQNLYGYFTKDVVEQENVTLTYVYNGTEEDVEVEKGTQVTLKKVSSTDKIFIGWYENNTYTSALYYDTYTPANNIKLYARFISLETIFGDSVTNPVKENISFKKSFEDISGLTIAFTSLTTSVIANTGIVDFSHKSQDAKLSMKVTYKGTTETYTKDIKVAPVTFDTLKQGESVFGYLYSGSMYQFSSLTFDNIFNQDALDALDCVNYGFARVGDTLRLDISQENFEARIPLAIKLREHGIRVLLCIGSNAKNFSDMAASDATINTFVNDVITCVEKYHFDGVDIDWEFPGVGTGRDVTVDRPNFTKLIRALRTALDNAQEAGGTPYLLTAAIPATSWGSARYEIGTLNNYLDYLQMMSYDLNDTTVACHHTNLYTSTQARAYGFSVDNGVTLFTSKGFSKEKLLAGMAFYGKLYTGATALGASASSPKTVVFTKIKTTYYTNSSYKQLWDDSAQAPYILNTSTGEYITYDSERSIALKCQYAKTKGLGGVMFWDYSEDTTHTLIKTIKDTYNK